MTAGGCSRAGRLPYGLLIAILAVHACSPSTLSGTRPSGVDDGNDASVDGDDPSVTVDGGTDGGSSPEGGEGPADGGAVSVAGKMVWTRRIVTGSVGATIGDWEAAPLPGGNFLVVMEGSRLTVRPEAGSDSGAARGALLARFEAGGDPVWERAVVGNVFLSRLVVGGAGFVFGSNAGDTGRVSVGPGADGNEVSAIPTVQATLLFEFRDNGVPVRLLYRNGLPMADFSVLEGSLAILGVSHRYIWPDSMPSDIVFSGGVTANLNQGRLVHTSNGRTAIVLRGLAKNAVTSISAAVGAATVQGDGYERTLIAVVNKGRVHWAVTAGQSVPGNARWEVAAADDGGLFVVGSVNVFMMPTVLSPGAPDPLTIPPRDPPGGRDFLARLSADGRYLWVRQFDSAGAVGVTRLSDGSAVVAGVNVAGASLQAGAGPGTVSLPDAGRFVARYDRDGNLMWQGSIPGLGNFSTLRLVGLSDDSVLIGGIEVTDAPGGAGGSVKGLVMTRLKF